MIYGENIKVSLAKKLSQVDDKASSHWNHYHKFLEIREDLSVKKTSGFGDGKQTFLPFANFLNYTLQYPFRKQFLPDVTFNKFYKRAQLNSALVGNRFSLDVLRQVLTLDYLNKNNLLENHNIAISIGDGFASMTSLLLGTGIVEKVVMINLTKTLFVDVSSALKIPEFMKEKAIALVSSEEEMIEAIKSKHVKIVAVEAKNSNLLSFSSANIAFNIASMQEMNMPQIEEYFAQFRRLASNDTFYFYCCNREEKQLFDGRIIKFEEYPWTDGDRHFFDELCPWHQYYYKFRPPFYSYYDGPIRHRFTKIKG